MKHRHEVSRKPRATGGVNDAAEDLKTKPVRYTGGKPEEEAEERKAGGRAKKHVGAVKGEHAKARADHKPRKNGGRVGADKNPFSSARNGSPAPGRKVEMEGD